MRDLIPAWLRTTVRLTCVRLTLATGLFASAHAFAQDYAAGNVGGWTVATSTDGKGCFLTREYPGTGKTTLLLGLDIDGTNHLSVLNENWSIQQKDQVRLNFRLSNGSYSKHLAVGMASGGKQGFVTNFETKFPAYFAASTFLHIDRGTVPVEQLNLDGSGAAVAELRRCVGMQRAKPATGAGRAERSDAIPKDPFAPEPKRKSQE